MHPYEFLHREMQKNLLLLKEKTGKIVPVLLTEHQAMRAYWGIGDIAPLIL
jgi:hypothetical protein